MKRTVTLNDYGTVELTRCEGSVLMTHPDIAQRGKMVDILARGWHFEYEGEDYMVHRDPDKPRLWGTTHLETGFAVHPLLRRSLTGSLFAALRTLEQYQVDATTDWYFERARRIRKERNLKPVIDWTLIGTVEAGSAS